MRKNITFQKTKHQNGFTLLEVLIALLILSIGLLGLAALQANTLKKNHGALQRTQAIFLTYDMMDRLRANRTDALAGNCDVVMGGTRGNSTMCDEDVTEWQVEYVAEYLPDGQGLIDCTTKADACEVTVQWDETRQGGPASNIASNLLTFTITADL